MSQQSSLFLRLPQELRDEIYKYALLDQRKIALTEKESKIVLQNYGNITTCIERPKASLFPGDPFSKKEPYLRATTSLSQVSRQIRAEFSQFLRTADVDVVARIHGFDFGHAIYYFRSLPPDRLQSFCVKEDGTAKCILKLELAAPDNSYWHANLAKWIQFVECWVGLEGELRTSQKTVSRLSLEDSFTCEPPEIVHKVYRFYQDHRNGAGRLELDKIFFTLLAKSEVECYAREGHRACQMERLLQTTLSRQMFRSSCSNGEDSHRETHGRI